MKIPRRTAGTDSKFVVGIKLLVSQANRRGLRN